MKLLMTRLAAGGLLGRSSRSASGSGMINRQSRRRGSFIDLVPTRRHMVTNEPSCPAPAPTPAADDDPRWMILNRWGRWRSDSTADAANVAPNVNNKTAAESRTSWGRPFRVFLSRAAPPAISSICFDRAGGAGHGPNSEVGGDDDLWRATAHDDYVHVVAAHGDSVLLKMSIPYTLRRRLGIDTEAAATDYFLYRATAAAAGGPPPSLTLLPTCHIPMHKFKAGKHRKPHQNFFLAERVFHNNDTGLLRCSNDDDGEVLVAQLQVTHEAPFDTAELCVLRPGLRDWELKEAVPIVHNNDEVGEARRRHDLGKWQELNAAVPAGNRFVCWVNYDCSTFLVCDMAAAEESPKLRYVPLPVKAVPSPAKEVWDDDVHAKAPSWQYYRSIGAATVGAGSPAVRFVSIDNRCCCGAPLIASLCERSSSDFVVTTWTMALNTTGEPMEWVKEGVLHCEELWAALLAAGDEDIPPRVRVSCPIVSSDNPDVVCFMAEDIDGETNGNAKSWTLELDMRRKTLVSAVSSCDRIVHRIQWYVRVN